jgi:hypothetical protein
VERNWQAGWSGATAQKAQPTGFPAKALSRQNRWVQLVLVATRDPKITKQTLTLVQENREKVAEDFCVQFRAKTRSVFN